MRCGALLVLSVLFGLGANAYEFEFETVATGLDHPTSMVFFDTQTALVTERNGRLRLIQNGELDPRPIDGVPTVYVAGQAGLFDVLLDPDFALSRVIYLSYAQGPPKANTLKIAKARLEDYRLENLEVIFQAEPLRATPVHYGGRMIVLLDGTLLIASGDGFDYRESAQSLTDHFGKTLRINRDGSVPEDNPFVKDTAARPEIFSFGHRNPQGLVIGSAGEIYLHEHGPRGGDELNLIQAGMNYGWPAITYGVDYSGAHVSPYTEYPGLQQPLVHWTPSIAPAGMTVYQGDLFASWRGNLLVSALVERSVRRVVIAPGKSIQQEILFQELKTRIRDIRPGPLGELYLLTDSEPGEIIRVTPKP